MQNSFFDDRVAIGMKVIPEISITFFNSIVDSLSQLKVQT